MNNDIPSGDLEGFKLEQRGPRGVYHASFWSDGKHCRKSLKTTNLKEAQRRLRRLAFEVDQGEYNNVSKKLILKDMAKQYLDHLVTENRSKKTMGKYTKTLNDFADFLESIRVTKAHQVLPTHFDQYRAARREQWSSYTLYNLSVVIKQLFKWALRRQLLKRNPLENYDLCKQRRVQHACPTQEEVKRILALVPVEYRLAVLVLACSGMRSGELCNLLVSDVDLEKKWFIIASREGAKTKSRESRKVPMNVLLLPQLRQHRPKGDYFLSAPPAEGFPAGSRQLSQKRLNDWFTKAVEQAGMTAGREALGFVIHSLRHFFKTFALNSGVPQPVVDSWMGHSLQGMNGVYYHLTDEDSQAQMQKLRFDLP